MTDPPYYRLVPQFLESEEQSAIQRLIPGLPEVAWLSGRQGTGYDKLPLRDAVPPGLRSLLERSFDALAVDIVDWDCYLLRYPAGTHIPPHTDPTSEHRHLRLNAVVETAGGGVLRFDGVEVPLAAGDAVVFRPDRIEHAVSRVDGPRYLWSVGCVF